MIKYNTKAKMAYANIETDDICNKLFRGMDEFMEFIVAKIPPSFDTSHVELITVSKSQGLEYPYTQLEISVRRPMTDEEVKEEAATAWAVKEAAKAKKRAEDKEKRDTEFELYHTLRDKFEKRGKKR